MYRSIDPDLSIRDFYRAGFRHKKKAALFFVISVSAAIALTIFAEKMYRSEALLFVRLGRENVGVDTTTLLGHDPVVAVPSTREFELNSVVEMLGSRQLQEEVVDRIGPDDILEGVLPTSLTKTDAGHAPESRQPGMLAKLNLKDTLTLRDRAIIHLSKMLRVEALKRTSVLKLSYDSPDPELSQKVLETAIDLYLADHVRLNRTPGAQAFMAEQTESVLGELRETEEQLRVLKDRTGLASPTEQRLILVQRIARLQDELSQADANLATTSAELDQLRKILSGQPQDRVTAQVSNIPNPSVDGMRQQLYALQLREKELRSKYTESHPEVKQIDEQIQSAQKILAEHSPTLTQTTHGPSRTFEETELSLVQRAPILAAHRARSETLREQLVSAQGEMKQMIQDELQIVALERQRQLLDVDYRRYAGSLEQTRIDELLEAQRISNISIAQPPSLNYKPVKPRRLINLGVGIAVGLFGAFAISFFCERLDRSFQTPEEIERRLNLPTLATIPRMQKANMAINGEGRKR